jgi:hypothetical protein
MAKGQLWDGKRKAGGLTKQQGCSKFGKLLPAFWLVTEVSMTKSVKRQARPEKIIIVDKRRSLE